MTKQRTSAPAGAAFHKDVQQPDPNFSPGTEPEFDPARPAKFDLGAFISGARQHTSTCVIPVTFRPDVAAEVERLTDERDKLTRVVEEDKAAGTSARARLSAPSQRANRLAELDTLIAELEPQLDGTWVLVKLRPLTPTEQDALRRRNLTPGVDLAAAIFATTGLIRAEHDDPDAWAAMDDVQWVELIEAIGPVQYLTLDKAHEGLTYQAVTPDFYERYSASRATRSTSSS